MVKLLFLYGNTEDFKITLNINLDEFKSTYEVVLLILETDLGWEFKSPCFFFSKSEKLIFLFISDFWTKKIQKGHYS